MKIKVSDSNPWVTDLQPAVWVARNGLDRGKTGCSSREEEREHDMKNGQALAQSSSQM